MFERIVKIKRTTYYVPETIVGIAVLVLLNVIVWPANPAYVGIDPNPYWIIVLAIAARYGRNGALFAGTLSAIVFLLHNIAVGGLDVFYDDLWLLRFPFLFILVGFMLGEIKTVFILREEYLTNRVEELENMSERLLGENGIIKEAHRNLTIELATKQDTITILNEITGRVKSLSPDEVYKGVLDSFRENIGAEECSFYEMEGDHLKFRFSLGWKDYYRRPEFYACGDGLIGTAANARHAVSIKDFVLKRHVINEDRPDMIGDSVLAVPIVGFEGHVFGVASVEKIPFLNLTESAIQTAKVICELAASSLNNAYVFRDMKEKQIRDDTYDIFKYHYFVARVNEEFLRSYNYMIPLSAMTFKWPKLASLAQEKRSALIESLITLLKKSLRPFDVLARGPNDEMSFVLLLSTTSGPQAEALKKKIIEHMRSYEFDKAVSDEPIEGTIKITAFDPHTMNYGGDFLARMGLQ